MTSLTDLEISQNFPVSKEEVADYIKRRKLKIPPRGGGARKAFRAKIRQRIFATKIRNAPGTEVSYTYSAESWQIVYGKMRIGGLISFINTVDNNNNLDLVYTLAGHKITSIDKVWIDEEQVIFGASPDPRWSTQFYNPDTNTYRSADHKVFMHLNDGDPGNGAISELSARTSLWTGEHRQSNRAHAFIILVSNAILFPDGIPDISFEVSGIQCHDPRTSTTGFTQNAALIILDYLTNTTYGLGYPLSECETASGEVGSFYDAANICDEDITLSDGSTEKRYTINAVFSSEETRQNILEKMMTAIGGTISNINGKWKCFPGKWVAPTITLDENDLLEDIEVQTKISRRDSFNGIKGTFTSAEKKFQEDDFPPYKNDFYKAQDNNERVWEDVQFPCTTSGKTCQRLAKLLLEKARQQIQVRGTFKLSGYQVEVGENVSFTYSRLGWYSKAFEVQESELLVGVAEGGGIKFAVRLLLRETASGVFDWNNGDETQYDLAPNTGLPDPFSVVALAGLTLESGTDHLYITSDGTVVSRIFASWTAATDGFVSNGGAIELEFKLSSAGAWNAAISLPANSSNYYILDVQDGAEYDVRIRAKNGLGIYSDYTTVSNHLVIGKTEPPSDVSSIGSSLLPYGIVLGWSAITDLDVSHYELREGAKDESWDSMGILAEVTGTTFEVNLRPAGLYKYAIKAVDTSGNYSVNEALTLISVAGPSAPSVSAQIVGPDLKLSWTESAGQFQIQDYIIRYGSSFDLGTDVGAALGLTHTEKIEWGGARTYWVAARDVAGNISTAGSVSLNIQPPSVVQNLTATPIDNNVLIKFEAPASSALPIEYYKILKGATLGTAELIGQSSATFSVLFETIGGTFTYWVVPVNTAGTDGAELSITTIVLQPPDYVLIDDQTIGSADWDSLSQCYTEGERLIGVIEPAHTWEDHFAFPNTSMQDLIDLGWNYYIEPIYESTGEAQKTIDYGTILGTVICGFSGQDVTIDDAFSLDITFRITVEKSTDGSTWSTVVSNVPFLPEKQLLISNFRYLRVTVLLNAYSTRHIVVLENFRVKLDVKQRDDSGGPVTASATDTSYTGTITIANPAVITATAHGWVEGTQVQFSTTGSLPTGITSGVTYIVRNPATNTFNISAEAEGDLITTTGSQSGTHTVKSLGTPVFFNEDYIDVSNVGVTLCPTAAQLAGATMPLSEIVNLLDAPNPKSFNVLVFDGNGARIACDFRWSARGV